VSGTGRRQAPSPEPAALSPPCDDQVHRQRTELIGQFACGFAHDLNNLLTVIVMQAGLLAGEASLAVPHRAELAELQATAERAWALTRRLLDFGRHTAVKYELLDARESTRSVTRLLRRLLRPDIEVVVDGPPLSERIFVDAIEFEQVVLNLALNARDAMPNGGTLTVDCSLAEGCADPARCDVHGTVRPGPHIRVSVRDTGPGIPNDIRERMFDPFFTTKAKGHGTGMGLTTVLGIVTGWGGHIVVSTREGAGATFDVFIPLAPSSTSGSRGSSGSEVDD
jgi:two-component system, cell cycle sensor histidine kinase and response regulator CckA